MKLLPAGPEPEAIAGELILGPKNSALYAGERAQQDAQGAYRQPTAYGTWQWGTSGATSFTFTTDTYTTRF